MTALLSRTEVRSDAPHPSGTPYDALRVVPARHPGRAAAVDGRAI